MAASQLQNNGVALVRRLWAIGGVGGVALLALAWYFLGVRTSAHRLDQIRSEIDQTYDFLSTEQRLRHNLVIAKSKHAGLLARELEARERAANARDEIAFLSWFGEQARANALTIKDYRPLGIVDYDAFQARVLQLAAEGDFETVCRTLDALRTARFLNRVTDLTINPVDASRTRFQLSLKLQLLYTTEDRATQVSANP